jgi:hypothetical protein
LALHLGAANDYGWFSPADLLNVINALHASAEMQDIVLVGGQSLTAWVQFYRIPLPHIEEPFLTQDADFIGSKEHALRVAVKLHGEAQIPGIDEHTPHTAVVIFAGEEGKPIQLDFLGAVLGIRNQEVRRMVVPLSVNGSAPFPTLHPLLVLESRFHNLHLLSEKRTGNGETQAWVACQVVERYLKECLSNPDQRRNALRAARRISALCRSQAGLYVWRRWGIDPMKLIEPERMPGQFRFSWKYDVAEVERKRVIAARIPAKASSKSAARA